MGKNESKLFSDANRPGPLLQPDRRKIYTSFFLCLVDD